MPDPAEIPNAANAVGGAVGGAAALGVLARLVQIIVDWYRERTKSKEDQAAARAERRARSKSEEITASHRAAELTLQLSDRQAREVDRANRERDEAEEELHDCKEAQRELAAHNARLSARMDAFEREHAGCPGAAAFAELRGKFEVMETQNEWMEKVIHEFTGLTPPSKSMPAPADVAAALQEETHGKR